MDTERQAGRARSEGRNRLLHGWAGRSGPSELGAKETLTYWIVYDLQCRYFMVDRPLPRVLIVDDQPEMARALMRVFGEEAQVTMATSGAAALAFIERESAFDLILCDVMMPEMTGPQLFQSVVVAHPQAAAAFVFTTGGVPPDQETRLRATGVPCLLKPIEFGALRSLLHIRRSAQAGVNPSSKGK